jgi:hypothetical protein
MIDYSLSESMATKTKSEEDERSKLRSVCKLPMSRVSDNLAISVWERSERRYGRRPDGGSIQYGAM